MTLLNATRRTKATRRPELVLSVGPETMGVPGLGTLAELYGRRWALAWYTSGPQLLQEQAGQWVEVIPGTPWPNLSGAGHLSLAFDQSAHHVLSWHTAAGVWVRQWSTQTQNYVYHGPFPGCDPCLMADAPLSGEVAGSDVVLWHLSADRAGLVYRLQRDYYATAYPVADLDAGAVLDQVAALPLRAELLGSTANGSDWAVLTSLYPTLQRDVGRAMARPRDGTYLPAVGNTQQSDVAGLGSAAPADGTYRPAMLRAQGAEPAMLGAAQPRGGAYRLALIRHSLTEPPMSATAAPGGGSYRK